MGCGGDSETLNRIQQVAQNASGVRPSLSSSDAVDQQQNPRFTRTNFVAPYPDREDAFVYPGMESESASPDSAVTSVADVQVLGFAETDQIRVMLRSRSTTQPIAVGGKFEGIEVVSITPPTVELKIGSLIWNATMFDKSR
ncbi:hypothetical protein K227x_44860 [Rubripirellula lacrimiformis]|uniref:Uncharacterized protein n=2 Tax=Rubripirellula lacrimiformis TaxID=1930273 RepID=A0A517NG13_9BACT|nr:hypothetical protein K227x_44860 [Rubripirellula lacrimiformis]